ncbi:cytochrome P450 1A1-like [Tubulanus polymorphus]|uniref:cytochrome P450 1A1-like n=1 Tax=Tubulanus polymorphus TaxID=672921 RepID=UPI003DA4616B
MSLLLEMVLKFASTGLWYDWLSALVLATLCAILAAIRFRFCDQNDSIPGPMGIPVLGNLLQLGKEPQKTLSKIWKKYGDVYQIHLGSRRTVVLNGAKTIRKALVGQADDFAGRPDFYSFKFIAGGKSMGFGDFTARWKMHRKIAQNALGVFINNQHNPIEIKIQKEALVLVDNLVDLSRRNLPNGINPHDEIYLSIGNIICAICFGRRYERDDPDFMELVKTNDEFMAFVGAGNPVDIMPWMRHFTRGAFDKFLQILAVMENLCKRKREEHVATYDPSHIRDMTDALIKTAQDIPNEKKSEIGLTDEHILNTVQEVIGAGFDTISTSLLWAILYMASYPEYQTRVHHEIMQVVGDSRLPRTSDRLPFTEACIYETMRSSCIFPFALPHSTTKDTFLNGHFIPEKTLIFVNQWSVTHDEDVFPQPDTYDPYRFITKDGKLNKSVMDKFFPYGCGRRRCPGEQLAKQELFIFFTTIMQRCWFEPALGVSLSMESKYGLTLKPRDFKVNVIQRNDKLTT